jgi:hypothetical protein
MKQTVGGRRRLYWIAGVALLWSVSVWAQQEITTIGAIVGSPVVFHRKPVVVQGIVKDVHTFKEHDVTGRPLCSQGFRLEDGTGTLEVFYKTRCQVGEETAVSVVDGDRLIVEATVQAPPTNLRMADGQEFGLWVEATKIVRQPK